MFATTDLPVGLVNIVHGGDAPGKALVASYFDGISLTGSVKGGYAIMKKLCTGALPPIEFVIGHDVVTIAKAVLETACTN